MDTILGLGYLTCRVSVNISSIFLNIGKFIEFKIYSFSSNNKILA